MKARVINIEKEVENSTNKKNEIKKKKIIISLIINVALLATIIALKFLLNFRIIVAFILWFGVNTLIAFGSYIIKSNTVVTMWLRLAFKLPKPEMSDNDKNTLLGNIGINFLALCVTLIIFVITGF